MKNILFGNQFSQFVKGSSELKYYRRLWGDNWLASRFLVGAGHAYGNSKVMPYSEQFSGGAEKLVIRAFTIRTLQEQVAIDRHKTIPMPIWFQPEISS
ncbi:MAG: hypothetical protein V8R52_10100 [Coprobacter fastidiosus]